MKIEQGESRCKNVPYQDSFEESPQQIDSSAINDNGPRDDILKNIQEDEEEIGPVDDDDVEQIYQKEGEANNEDIQALRIIDNLDGDQGANGEYYDGDEPEEDDSQQAPDDHDDFDDEEGEDEDHDDDTDNDEVAAMSKTAKSKQTEMIKVNSGEEPDCHSKVSTACTNEEQMLFKIKIGSGGETRSRKKQSMKIKKQNTNKSTAKVPSNNLDEETKNIIDNQLDQLIIEKPAALQNQVGKDRSLKEAFLRRPPNNVITLHYGPFLGRLPSIFFNYPPFLKIQRPYR